MNFARQTRAVSELQTPQQVISDELLRELNLIVDSDSISSQKGPGNKYGVEKEEASEQNILLEENSKSSILI